MFKYRPKKQHPPPPPKKKKKHIIPVWNGSPNIRSSILIPPGWVAWRVWNNLDLVVRTKRRDEWIPFRIPFRMVIKTLQITREELAFPQLVMVSRIFQPSTTLRIQICPKISVDFPYIPIVGMGLGLSILSGGVWILRVCYHRKIHP